MSDQIKIILQITTLRTIPRSEATFSKTQDPKSDTRDVTQYLQCLSAITI